MHGRVLIVAGSDSGGGAGIQADIKAVTALGGYAATAVTALTAQNTLGVHGVWPVPVAFVQQQMRVVLDDIGADVVKTGMLHDAAMILGVVAELRATPNAPRLVVDPVMIAKGGARLLEAEAVEALVAELVPRASLLTPNAVEAEALSGIEVHDERSMERAGARLVELGASAVLVKGGHVEGNTVVDLLIDASGTRLRLEAPRIESRSTHGTGCTLASAIAVSLAQGRSLPEAVERAHGYVRRAIETAPGYGQGHGPLNHAHCLDRDA
jgi:hydroxymethylpyrimidine/phosphomethylpyrimidine kinase